MRRVFISVTGPWLMTRSDEQSASGQCSAGGATHGAPAIETNCCCAAADAAVSSTQANALVKGFDIITSPHHHITTSPHQNMGSLGNVAMATRSSRFGSFIAFHSLSMIIVVRSAAEYGAHFGMPV